MQYARAPFLAAPETTREQEELAAARMAPPADITPVDAQDYLDHVPG